MLALAWLAPCGLWVHGASPWAAATESAAHLVEVALGRSGQGFLAWAAWYLGL